MEVLGFHHQTHMIVIVWIAMGVIGALIGREKDRAGDGFCLGLLLGPIGLIIALFLKPRNRKECPHCRSAIHRDASVCPHCQREQPLEESPPEDSDADRMRKLEEGTRLF